MTRSKIIRLAEGYGSYSAKQSSKAVEVQLQSLANKVLNRSCLIGRPAKIRTKAPETFLFLNRPLDISAQNVFLDMGPPYMGGSPYPEYTANTGGTATGSYFNIEALGDYLTGRFSVGVNAGYFRNAPWTGGTYYSLLPDRWMWGDCIVSPATILQVAELPNGPQPGTPLSAIVQFSWDPQYKSYGGWPVTSSQSYLSDVVHDALRLTAGQPGAAMGGLVACVASVELHLSLWSDTSVLATSTTTNEFLSMAVDVNHPGDTDPDKPAGEYLWSHFAFAESSPWTPLNLLASVNFVEGAKQLVIETNVRLVGARGGVNDPNAGFVAAAFQNITKGASPVWSTSSPNPFLLNRITAFYVS